MAEKRTIELEVQDNSKTLKQQYKDAVKELQKMVATYGEMSDEAINAAKAAAQLKDQIEDTNDLMQSFKGEGAFVAMSKAMSSVASGFSAVEGGLALIGVESEKVQETILRVQAAMALAQGLEGLEDAGRAFTLLGSKAKTALKGIKTELIATGIGALVVALGTIVAYWDDIKSLVGGVNAETQRNVELTQEKLLKSERELDVFEKQENQLRLQGKSEEEIIKLREKKIQQVIETAKKEKALQERNKKAEVAAAERNQKFAQYIIQFYATGLSMGLYIITGIIDGISNAFIFLAKSSFNYGKQLRSIMFEALIAPLELALKGVNKLLELAGASTFNVQSIFGGIRDTYAGIENQISGFINSLEGTSLSKGLFEMTDKYVSQQLASVLFDPKAVADSYDKTITGLEDKILEGQDKIAQGQISINQKAQNGITSQNAQSEKERLDLERQNIDKRIELMADGYDKEIALAKEKAKREKEDLIKSAEDKIINEEQFAEAQRLIDAKLKKDLRELDIKYNSDRALTWEEKNKKEIDQKKIEFDQEMEAMGKRIALREAEAEKKKKIEAEELQRRNELRQKTLELTANTFSALSELAGSFNAKNEQAAKRQFLIQKAFNLGAAITNTAMAVTGALTAGGNPLKLATGQQFVEAGIAAAVGAANIIKIANSRFGGGASGGGGSSDVPTPQTSMTANFQTIGTSGINQLATLQQQPVQAYVVSGEVTSAQALDRNRVQNATL